MLTIALLEGECGDCINSLLVHNLPRIRLTVEEPFHLVAFLPLWVGNGVAQTRVGGGQAYEALRNRIVAWQKMARTRSFQCWPQWRA